MNKHTKNDKAVERAADIARESRERVAAAWAELVEAARTDPKARAFLAAFGMLEEPVAALQIGAADGGSDSSDGDGRRPTAGDGAGAD
jgi:hypothetical protein